MQPDLNWLVNPEVFAGGGCPPTRTTGGTRMRRS